ncbi:hypothetical protein HOLleu_29183 [Holothuria leucospilota]|uniref:Uncharacterized protein n=1 Tax=Holothuria leucospilota TaxID=206669 RepID=A0A9Q1BNJ8_HOLLE|nr:hypothetical protein HOLleu_29183 [Holothuria leucospilota]
MWGLFAGSVILLNFSAIVGSTDPYMEETQSESSYSYTYYMLEESPFHVPGLAVADLHATQFLDALAGLWHSDRIIDGVALMCEDLGPKLKRPGLKGSVRAICGPIRNSDAEKSCRYVWDATRIGIYYNSYNLFDRSICIMGRGYGWPGNAQLFEQYPLITEVKHFFVDTLFNFTLYDCSRSGRGIEKINNIIFALMDWLGPFAMSITSVYRYEPHMTCSMARYLLSMETTDFIENSIQICKYPVADILEYLGTADICQSDTDGIEVLTNILVELSDLSKSEFCEYVSEKHTRNEHLEKAVIILQNALHLFHDERRCNNVLSILAPLDKSHVHVKYVGFDLSVPSERRDFCQQAINSFSQGSSYVTSPYRFPSDLHINEWQPFTIPGKFLPELSFIDLIGIEGAAYRAGTIIEGWSVYCNVFEEFLVQIIDDETFDAASICEFVKSGNTEGLEDICVSLLMEEWHDESYRFGGFHYDLLSYVFYTVGNLTGVRDINKDEICRAADNLFHSDISFKNLVEAVIDAHMREAIPLANRYCQHWEEAKCYWNPYCYLSDQPRSNYFPSRETVATEQASFEEKFSSAVSLTLTLLGFDDMDSFCSAVSEDIDPSSGRAVGDLTERLRSELIRSFTIVGRCSQFLDTILGFFPADQLDSYVFPEGDILYQLSGFRSSSAFCNFLSDLLLHSGTTTLQPDTTEFKGASVASYDAFMKIAIYLRGKSS